MTSDKRRECKTTALSFFAIGLLCLSQITYAAGSYLQELEAEAARTGSEDTQEQQAAEEPEWDEDAPQLDSEHIESGLTKQQFETQLEKNFYGSYLFYSALEAGKQQEVYNDYQNANDIKSIRNSIKSRMKD